jgi:hypothetical protein
MPMGWFFDEWVKGTGIPITWPGVGSQRTVVNTRSEFRIAQST